MKQRARQLSVLLMIAIFAIFTASLSAQTLPPEVAKQGYADSIVINAKVVSMDDWGYNNNPGHIYEAMAIKNQRIQALNTTEYIKTLANADTKVYDAKGQTVMPGVVESHVHIFGDAKIAAEMGITSPGKYVSVKETVRGFKMILDGQLDDVAEGDFYMKGGIDEVLAAAKKA